MPQLKRPVPDVNIQVEQIEEMPYFLVDIKTYHSYIILFLVDLNI